MPTQKAQSSSRNATSSQSSSHQDLAQGAGPGSQRGQLLSDEKYALVSVLYHACQGAYSAQKYVADAEASGDDEILRFLRQIEQEEINRAQKACDLLAMRLRNKDNRANTSNSGRRVG